MIAPGSMLHADAVPPGAEIHDLRRRLASGERACIVRRSRWLGLGDQALLCAVYDEGLHVSEVARRTGASVFALRRRVRRLVHRIFAPEFTLVIRQAEDWPPLRRAIAVACICRGEPQRRVAAELSVSRFHVAREIRAIAILAESCAGRPAGGFAGSKRGRRSA